MPEKPPKEWWDKMYSEVKKGNPSYSDEQARKTVGDIWYNKMGPSKKKEETKKSEGSVKKVAMNIKLDNLDHDDGLVLVTAENAEEAQNDQSIMGSNWEFDGDLAYALISDMPNLVQQLTSEGYTVDDSEYWAMEEKKAGKVADKQDIVAGFADAVFNSAWVDYLQARNIDDDVTSKVFEALLSGKEVENISPETPSEVQTFATQKVNEIEATNKVNFDDFVSPYGANDWDVGWDLGMHFLGEEAESHGLNIPHGSLKIETLEPPNKYKFWMEGNQMTAPNKSPEKKAQVFKPNVEVESDGVTGNAIVTARWADVALMDSVFGERWDHEGELAFALLNAVPNVELANTLESEGYTVVNKKELESREPKAATEDPSATPGTPVVTAAAGFGGDFFADDAIKQVLFLTVSSVLAKAPNTPQAVISAINESAPTVVAELSKYLLPEVLSILQSNKEEILKTLEEKGLPTRTDPTSDMTIGPAPKPAPAPVAPIPAVDPNAVQEPAPAQAPAPVAASAKAPMTYALKKEFRKLDAAQKAIHEVVVGTFGDDFHKKVTSAELIDEENLLIDIVSEENPKIKREDLETAFGSYLDNVYSEPAKENANASA